MMTVMGMQDDDSPRLCDDYIINDSSTLRLRACEQPRVFHIIPFKVKQSSKNGLFFI